MLRQDGERKNQAIKQAEKDKKALSRQLAELRARYEQASAGLVQLTQETASLKQSDTSEKTRLKAQKEKLENLCRVLRAENTKLKQPADSDPVPKQPAAEQHQTSRAATVPEQSATGTQQHSQPSSPHTQSADRLVDDSVIRGSSPAVEASA